MKLLIIYPTRGRKDLFFQTMDNLQQTIGTKNYEVIINIDNDDKSMTDDDTISRIYSSYRNVSVFVNEPISKVFSCNQNVDKASGVDWILLMADDFKFVVDGWYSKMISDIKSVWGDSLDFFAHYNDNFVGDKLPIMNIVGIDYYKRDNNIFDPSYGGFSCDAENFYKSQMRGKHHYFPQVYFHHIHPSNLRFPTDETYRRNDKFGKADTENYFNRMKRYFDVPKEQIVMIPEQLKKEIEKLK